MKGPLRRDKLKAFKRTEKLFRILKHKLRSGYEKFFAIALKCRSKMDELRTWIENYA